MPCYIRMKRIFLQGLIWLYLLGFGFMALSLEPGFLDFDNLPDTNFSCVGKVIGGYYADLETNCQMFHVCTIGQLDEPMDIRFLCLNGTVFDQETRVCERIDEVDCSKSEQFYSLNLELYGNTQPAILPEESPETDEPLEIKTTTTTTTTPAPKKTSRAPYYTTVTTPTVTTPSAPQVISTHHFPLVNSPDIRFNPEEINISLHPGAPPDIRTKPVTFQQQSYSGDNKKGVVTTHSENSDNKKVSVTTHSAVFDENEALPNHGQGLVEMTQVSSTQKPRPSLNYVPSSDNSDLNFHHATPSDINYEFSYHDTEPGSDYQTEEPQIYNYHSDFRPSQKYSGYSHGPHSQQFKSSTFLNDYNPTTSKLNSYQQQKSSTTVRNYFLESLEPPPLNQRYGQQRTEKSQRVQLALPGLPTLPPLTFSSPAPFTLRRHIETKRYTKDHQAPPRIIISASASVSDASGRRLNYSLGTIGAAEILEQPPQSYDEYKDDDVGLDPFYHDVPKIKRSRTKRETKAPLRHLDIIRNEQEAVDVLKFLFEWYKSRAKTDNDATTTETTPVNVTDLHQLDSTTTTVLTPTTNNSEEDLEYNFKSSALFDRNSRYSIIGNGSDDQQNSLESTITTHTIATTEVPSRKTTGYEDELFLNEDYSLESTQNTSNTDNDVTTIGVPIRETTGFVDELFQHEEDYVNDNYEPIAYEEKYGKRQDNKSAAPGLSNPAKESRRKSLPKDYVDDNLEPIYYRTSKEVPDDKGKAKATDGNKRTDSFIKHDKTTGSTPTYEYVIRYHKSQNSNDTKIFGATNDTVLSSKVGDTETNNINKKIVDKENNSAEIKINFPRKSAENIITTVTYSPEPLTTRRPTSISKERGRGRVRNQSHTVTESAKDAKTNTERNTIVQRVTYMTPTITPHLNESNGLAKLKSTKQTTTEPATTVKPRDDYMTATITLPLNESNGLAKLKSAQQTSIEPATTVEPRDDLVPIITIQQTVTSTTERSVLSTTKRTRSRNRQAEIQRRKTNNTTPRFKEFSNDNSGQNTSILNKTQSYETKSDVKAEGTIDIKTPKISRSDANNEIVIELNSSNIKNKIVPYSDVIDTTTETYTSLSPDTKFNVGRENAQFLNQLTINYKKLFVDNIIAALNTSDMSTTRPESPDDFTAPYVPTTTSPEEITTGNSGDKLQNRNEFDSGGYLFLTPSETINFPRRNTLQDTFVKTSFARKEIPDYTTPAYLSELFKSTYYDPTIMPLPHTKYTPSTIPPITETTNSPTKEAETTAQPWTVGTLPAVDIQKKENYPTTSPAAVSTEINNNWRTEINQSVENATATQLTSLIPEEEPMNGFTTEEGQSIEIIPNTQFSTNTEPTSERGRTKYLLIINTQTDPVTEFIPTTQTTESNTGQYTQAGENISTTQYRTEVSIQGETVFPSTPPNAITQTTQGPILDDISTTILSRDIVTEKKAKKMIPNEDSRGLTTEINSTPTTQYTSTPTTQYTSTPTTQWSTGKLRQTILGGLRSFFDLVTPTDISKQDYTSAATEPSTFLATAPSTQILIGEIGSTTNKALIDAATKPTIGDVSTETNIVTITYPVHNNKDLVTTEKNKNSLIKEIEEITGSAFSTTKVPQLLTTQRLDGTSTVFETTPTLMRFEDKAENTESQNIPTAMSQLERAAPTELPTTTFRPSYYSRRSRPTRRRTSDKFSRHRFSTETFSRRPERKQTIVEEIIDALSKKSYGATTPINRRMLKANIEEYSTDAPLQRSASPTRAERLRPLPTIPLSRAPNIKKFYIFNCFGREIDKFYPDPRDCRLFHYCTQGYNKNQLLDMKFVCDLNTYFDDEKLICTKRKPRRCL